MKIAKILTIVFFTIAITILLVFWNTSEFKYIATIASAENLKSFPLQEMKKVPLLGNPVRFDYQSIDQKNNKLYISHMNDDALLVYDLKTDKLIKSIPANGVHGVLVVAELNLVFASATDSKEIITIDGKNDTIINRAKAGEYADGLAYDFVEKHIFVTDEGAGQIAVLDRNGNNIANINIGGEGGNIQYDSVTRHVFVNVQNKGILAEIDPKTNKIINRIKLSRYRSNHGLYIDSKNRLAFITCTASAKLLVLDMNTMKIIDIQTTGLVPDVIAFDATLNRLYIACESGVVSIFQENNGALKKIGEAKLNNSAHTVAVDQKTHFVYLPLEKGDNGKPQMLIMKPNK